MNTACVDLAGAGTSRRSRRAAVAQRLLAKAPGGVEPIDWDTLDRAPAWLALDDTELATLQCRIGAVLCAPALRLWIDGPRLNAARNLLGEPFLLALLAQPESASIPADLIASPRIDSAALAGLQLRSAGAAVLLASLTHGALRRAASVALAPGAASTLSQALAESLVAQAEALAVDALATRADTRSVQ